MEKSAITLRGFSYFKERMVLCLISQEKIYTKLRAVIQLGNLGRALFWNVAIRQKKLTHGWWKLSPNLLYPETACQNGSIFQNKKSTILVSTFHAL